MNYSTRLRELIEHDELVVCPGVHDPLSARVVDALDFEAAYMTGYGTSVSKLGYPDAGFITLPEIVSNAENVQETLDVPLVADADNGYGDAKNVIRTVREYVRSDVAGIHIEDQTFPKRCGHVKGKRVIPKEEAAGKYRAAADVRDDLDEDFVIIARSDARGAVGGTLEDAIERVSAYCEAGADVGFVEGPVDEGEVERVGDAFDVPLLYNPGSISPRIDHDRLEELGFDIVIYATLSLQAAIIGLFEYVDPFEDDPIDAIERLDADFDDLPIDGMHSFSGFPEVVEWEDRYLPAADTEKYDRSVGDDPTE